ncbi:MAG: 50S ribosomal protein L17 [Patescibacteria group bacterium]
MRHQVKGRKLSRSTHQRQALFKGLLNSLIRYETIKTTEAKAKSIKGQLDKMMTLAKKGTLAARRQAFAFLTDKETVHKLFTELADRSKARASGFTRLVRLGRRLGDNAMITRVEFVDKKEVKK